MMAFDRIPEALSFGRKSLASYSCAICPDFQLAPNIKLIISKLEEVEQGKLKRLLVTAPPRHGKSVLVSQIFPAWYLGRHPEESVITSSYSQELSDGFGRRTRGFILHEHHQNIFPEARMLPESSAANRFNTTAGGNYYAVGFGSPITGRGASIL